VAIIANLVIFQKSALVATYKHDKGAV